MLLVRIQFGTPGDEFIKLYKLRFLLAFGIAIDHLEAHIFRAALVAMKLIELSDRSGTLARFYTLQKAAAGEHFFGHTAVSDDVINTHAGSSSDRYSNAAGYDASLLFVRGSL